MSPETIKLMLLIFGQSLVRILADRGKFDEAALIGDALAALRAGRNIEAALGVLTEQWATVGEPNLADISTARLAIQEQLRT